MKKADALSLVQKELPEKRLIHTMGVVEAAIQLAEQYGADKEKAELAAILHDLAKYWPRDAMRLLIEESPIDNALLTYHLSLWHAPVGAYYIEKHGLTADQEILDAIRFHTTGRRGMTLLEKIVFLADYIEPGRRFPGVDDVRAIAKENLDLAVLQALINTMKLLIDRKQQIHPDTINAYNDIIELNREA